MNSALRAFALSTVAMTFFAAAASAQVLESIDLNPIDSTSWNDASVRVNFGAAGPATISFSSINGGAFANAVTPFEYNAAPYSAYNGPTALSNGALFSPTQESVFTVQPGSAPGLAGFTMTVTLDSGSFDSGSMFSVRSLGRLNDRYQYFNPGAGLGAPDSVQLPTDGSGAPDMVLIDSALNLYGAAANTGASKGLAFGITGSSSFTASFLSTSGYQPGGVAFTFVVPQPVPEPSTYALLFAGLAAVVYVARRRSAN
jgi:hypothetical protein